jgi:hypothetical protein
VKARYMAWAALAALGCGSSEPHLGGGFQELVVDNGSVLNGVSPNGVSPNGVSPNGVSPNGVSPNGVSPNGVSPNGVLLKGVAFAGSRLSSGAAVYGSTLVGSLLVGWLSDGRQVAGKELVGARFQGLLSNGTALELRIDAVSQGTPLDDDVWFYRFSHYASGKWQPTCGVDGAGNPVSAIPLRGIWNYGVGPGGGSRTDDGSAFTFACRGFALAKCVEMGFRPWRSGDYCYDERVCNPWSCWTNVYCTWIPWTDVHQACTRALRADYCGDGNAWTANGKLVNVYDRYGVAQTDTAAWPFEAEWGPNGPVCVRSALRKSSGTSLTCAPPTCALPAGSNGGWVATEYGGL